MTCEKAQALLPMMLYGECSFEEEEQLESHLAQCELCQVAMARQSELHDLLDDQQVPVPAALLQQCRTELKSRVAVPEAAKPASWWSLIPVGNPFAMLARPAAAFALILVGFGLARYTSPQPDATQAAFAGKSNGPIAVRVRDVEPAAAGQIRIVIEESRERQVSGKLDDDPIRQLLLAAARESADPGLRVESMDILKTQPESQDVRRALLAALQHDENPGVRLKALEGLRPFSPDPDVRHALTQVLLTDSNPGVRTQAIDLLIQKKEAGLAGVLQEAMHREDNQYVRQRCQKALQEMHASTETF